MDFFQIFICVFLAILGSTLTLHAHGKGEIESDRDEIITDHLKAENSRTLEPKSRVVRQYENLENGRQLAIDLQVEKEARKKLEVQMEEMQEKLNSIINSKNNIEDAISSYLSSSVMSIFVSRGLRGLENNISNLRTEMRRLKNKVDDITSSQIPKLNKTLGDITNFENTGYQKIKFEISPIVPLLEANTYTCESMYSQPYIPCNEGWFPYGEKCYKIFLEWKTWTDASRDCRKLGGHLATVSSHELQEFLNIFFILRERTFAWIGINDRAKEAEFVWDDGSPIGFTNWDWKQPDSKNGEEDCVYAKLGTETRVNAHILGFWNDYACTDKEPYICQLDKNKGVKNLFPDPRFCPGNEGGGFKYRESCFNIVRTRKSWEEAQKHCEKHFGGNLVTILDTEAEMFLNYILSNINEDFWIGIKGHEKATQKWIKWSSGWPVAHNRLNLDLRQFPTGTCVLRSNEYLWTTMECSSKLPFICETTKRQAPVLKKAPNGWQCPDTSKKWIDLGGESCYFIGTNKNFGWYHANYDCGRKGGTLASINSDDEAKIFQYFVVQHHLIYIGLHRSLANKDIFEWADGSTMVYETWGQGEPNNKKEDCVELSHKTYVLYYVWNDIDCYGHKERLYICEAKKVPPSRTESTTSNTSDCTCPDDIAAIKEFSKRFPCPHLSEDWQDVEGEYCYIFETSKSLTWDEAHYECGRKGGSLASIHSEEQSNVLQQYVKNSARSVYIGLHRSFANKILFEWSDGSKVDFENWRPSEPSDIKEECVEMNPENMKWSDVNCSTLNRYICSAKKVPSSLMDKREHSSNNCACP